MKKGLLTLILAFALSAHAELRPEKVRVADTKKTQAYVHDGLVTGGDQAIDQVVVKDIRRAANADFERVVVDLEGTLNGEPAAIDRSPYFQVSITPDEKRVVFTVWGKPQLAFEAKKVIAGFKKSHLVDKIELLPRLEDDNWTFTLNLKNGQPVEVFELTNPVRVILDIKNKSGSKSDPES